jgi:two-component system phosphate regulon response regulator PhoB
LADLAAIVLVVDDNADFVETTCEVLRDAGYDARPAENADTALFYIARADRLPDLILLDLRMPGLSIERFLSELKKREDLARIPVVLMTGAARSELPGGVSVDAILMKPFGVGVLLTTVQTLLSIDRCSPPQRG